MKKYIYILFLAVLAVTSSCSTHKSNIGYFKNIEDLGQVIRQLPKDYNIKIQPEDELVITVSSAVPEATAIYNVPQVNSSKRAQIEVVNTSAVQTYVVDSKGFISMPILGKIQAEGKTTEQLSDELTKLIARDVKDPYVRVQLSGYRVEVLGEVTVPGATNVRKEKYTILDALADAGDLTVYGNRENVLLLREEDGQLVYHRLNLNDANVLKSPYFYLKQNDVIYVEPNNIKKENSKYNQNNAFKLSVISTVVSAASVIASLIIALTVNK